jgi:hypothetical protein
VLATKFLRTEPANQAIEWPGQAVNWCFQRYIRYFEALLVVTALKLFWDGVSGYLA